LCLTVSATHIYCHTNCISHNGDDAHKEDDTHTDKTLVPSEKMKVVKQVNFILIFDECFVSHMLCSWLSQVNFINRYWVSFCSGF